MHVPQEGIYSSQAREILKIDKLRIKNNSSSNYSFDRDVLNVNKAVWIEINIYILYLKNRDESLNKLYVLICMYNHIKEAAFVKKENPEQRILWRKSLLVEFNIKRYIKVGGPLFIWIYIYFFIFWKLSPDVEYLVNLCCFYNIYLRTFPKDLHH